MKHSDQQNTTQSIVSYNRNKVVDGRNKWSGCYRRVDIDLLEESIDARVENQGNIFKDYAPEQYSIVQDYELYIKDNIVFFVISKNAESIKKNFKDILKQH